MVKTIGLYKLKDISKIDECMAAFKMFAESIPLIQSSEIGRESEGISHVCREYAEQCHGKQ